MVQHLQSVVLLVLDRIEAEVEFCQLGQLFDELQLEDLADLVEREVQEAKRFNLLEPTELHDVVLRQIQSPQHFQLVEALNVRN